MFSRLIRWISYPGFVQPAPVHPTLLTANSDLLDGTYFWIDLSPRVGLISSVGLIAWIGLISWINYPGFEQLAPDTVSCSGLIQSTFEQ